MTVVSANSDSKDIPKDTADEKRWMEHQCTPMTSSSAYVSHYSTDARNYSMDAARDSTNAASYSTNAASYSMDAESYSMDAARYSTDAARCSSLLDLCHIGPCIGLEECPKNVKNGAKIIQYKYTSLKECAWRPEKIVSGSSTRNNTISFSSVRTDSRCFSRNCA